MSDDKKLEPEHTRKIFIGGLDRNTTSESLRIPFEPFGSIVDCVVICDSKTHESRGFGFVTYEMPSSVDEVVRRKANFKVDGRQVDLKRAVPRNEPVTESTTKIFVGGLAQSVTSEKLQDAFSHYGKVIIAEVMRDREGVSRGFGFVTFNDSDIVTKLANQKRVEVEGKMAEVKRAEPRGAVKSGRYGDRDDYSRGGGGDYRGYDRDHGGGYHHGGGSSLGSRGYSDMGSAYSYGYGAGAPASGAGYGGMAAPGYRRDPFMDYGRGGGAPGMSTGYGYGYPSAAPPGARDVPAAPNPATAASYPVGTPYAQAAYGYGPGQMKGYGAEGGGGGPTSGGAAAGANRYRPY